MTNFKLNNSTVCNETDRAHLSITYICNNNCLFCLQGYHPLDTHRLFEDLIHEIDVLARNNVKKIILSGGEPTIHPDFLRLVKYCKQKGFSQIQVISNGRMFSIPKFVEQSYKSGVTEVTLSIHGKDAKTHDTLVKSKGAFNQILKAVANLKKYPFLISVDVGIFSKNYIQLLEIVKMINGELGLKGDIDLIGPIMNGSAFENRFEVMPPYELVEPYLKQALNYAKINNLVCWVLRVPLKYIEGYEVYKQDNNKLIEKSLSLKKMLEQFPPKCMGEKCEYCRMDYVCKQLVKIYPVIEGNVPQKLKVVIDSKNSINLFQTYISRIKFSVSELVFLVNPSIDILNMVLKSNLDIGKIIIMNLFDKKIIDFVNKFDFNEKNKIVLQYDFVSFDTRVSNYFNINFEQLSDVEFILKDNMDFETNLIITKKNYTNLINIINQLISHGAKKINFTNFNPYNFLKRDTSWETGVKILDVNDVVVNLYLLEKYLLKAILYCEENNVDFSIREFPFCVFSDNFLNKNKSKMKQHEFISTISLDSLDENKFNFPNYVKYMYNTIYKEKIKQCDRCIYNNNCAGFDDMYLKLYSLKRS